MRRPSIEIFFLLALYLEEGGAEDLFKTQDFGLCPEDYPIAVKNGQQCCRSWPPCDADGNGASAVPCELPPCDDFDFEHNCFDHLATVDGKLRFKKTQFFEANRVTYRSIDGLNCVWWYRADRHWWVGPCNKVGTNDGIAFLEEDCLCPYCDQAFYNLGKPQTWRNGTKGKTGNIIPGVKFMAGYETIPEEFFDGTTDRLVSDKAEVDLCPEGYPFVFDSGLKCCKELDFWNETRCTEAAFIDCPFQLCETKRTQCPRSIHDSYYEVELRNEGFFEASRPIYIHGNTCIWWFRATRNWWFGPCINVGTNNGTVYLREDCDCPAQTYGATALHMSCDDQTWVSKDTGEVLEDLSFRDPECHFCGAPADPAPPERTTAFAAVITLTSNAFRNKRPETRSCTFKYYSGKYRCN